MKNNLLFRLFLSLPVILVLLYFIPFLGVCLILFRYFIYYNEKRVSVPVVLIVVGIVILVPKILGLIMGILNFDLNIIPSFGKFLNSDLYNVSFISYSKFLITVGIIFFVGSYFLNNIINKTKTCLRNGARDYVSNMQKRDMEISRENDMRIKLKQEKAKNTSYVKCPYCGSDNLVSLKFDTCKFCRRKIENKNYNS